MSKFDEFWLIAKHWRAVRPYVAGLAGATGAKPSGEGRNLRPLAVGGRSPAS
jgi:hypothetical protein